MKKLLMLIIFSIMLISIGISGHNCEINDTKHEIYIPRNSLNIVEDNTKIVNCGTFDIVRVDDKHYDKIRDSADIIIGESIAYDTSIDEVRDLINRLDIEIIKRNVTDDKITIFGYSPHLDKSIKLYGKAVNIEIVYGNNRIEIGTPIIMGDY